METIHVFQIGLGSFGRHGFEKLVEMDRNLKQANVQLEGIAEKDVSRRERAKRFAEAAGVDLETFSSAEEMYSRASEREGTVMIYDAGPTSTHASHVYESMRHGFFHVAEKPPSMNEDQHIKERKMAAGDDVFWKADFIERENPAVRQAIQEVRGREIESIRVYRQSSIGAEKTLDPVHRSGVQGGDVLDKMAHEIYVLDLLSSASSEEPRLQVDSSEAEYLMPYSSEGEYLMDSTGNKTRELDEAATAQTVARLECGTTQVVLNSGWLGVSERARREVENLDMLDYSPIEENYRTVDGSSLLYEEARFFVIEGERSLMGDMLSGRLFDLESGEEIETPDLIHDQLYRVLRKAVLRASGVDTGVVSDHEIDQFMRSVFEVRRKSRNGAKGVYSEASRASDRVRSLIFDPKEFEDETPVES